MRRLDLYYTIGMIVADAEYKVWIYPFMVPVQKGAMAKVQLNRLTEREEIQSCRVLYLCGPLKVLLHVLRFLDQQAPYFRADPNRYFAVWFTGRGRFWKPAPRTFEKDLPDGLVFPRAMPRVASRRPEDRDHQEHGRQDWGREITEEMASQGRARIKRAALGEKSRGSARATASDASLLLGQCQMDPLRVLLQVPPPGDEASAQGVG